MRGLLIRALLMWMSRPLDAPLAPLGPPHIVKARAEAGETICGIPACRIDGGAVGGYYVHPLGLAVDVKASRSCLGLRTGTNPPHINPKELDLLDKEPGWVQYVQRSFRGLGHCRTVAKPSKKTDLLAFSAAGLGFLSLGLTRGLAEGPTLTLVPLRYVVEDTAPFDGAVLTTCGTDAGCVAEAQRVLGERFVPPPPGVAPDLHVCNPSACISDWRARALTGRLARAQAPRRLSATAGARTSGSAWAGSRQPRQCLRRS